MSVPSTVASADIVSATPETFALPSILKLPVTSPVNVTVLEAAHLLAVLALPVNAAVIVPALKLPLESLNTIVLPVLAVVAVVVAEFA